MIIMVRKRLLLFMSFDERPESKKVIPVIL